MAIARVLVNLIPNRTNSTKERIAGSENPIEIPIIVHSMRESFSFLKIAIDIKIPGISIMTRGNAALAKNPRIVVMIKLIKKVYKIC